MSPAAPRGSHRGGIRRSPRRDSGPWQVLEMFLTASRSAVLRVAAVGLVVAVVVALSLRDTGSSAPEPTDVELTPAAPISGDSREAALSKPAQFANDLLQTWSQPQLSYARWWKQVSPLLTPGAREAYRLTDPDLVPRLDPLTFDEVVEGPSVNTATVWFKTAAGRFGVDLSRRDQRAPWLAQRVVFPGGRSIYR